ncbi:MAG: molybdopterin-dependent oxidoreductase [Bacillota bacterium]
MHRNYFYNDKPVFITLLFILLAVVLVPGCGAKEIPVGTVLIEGDGIEEKAAFTLDELKVMEEGLVEADYLAINSYGTKEYFHFKGVWIWYVLQKKVSLKEDASKVSFIAEDGYKVEYSIKDVKKEDYIDEQNLQAKYKMILAWEEDGREYDMKHGNPFQLVVGQKAPGDVNKPYWVRNIKTIRID